MAASVPITTQAIPRLRSGQAKLNNITVTAPTATYLYDANGNVTTDGRTAMKLRYNYLNLVDSAGKSGTVVKYIYDGSGRKLRKTSTVSSTTTQRDYIDGIEYNKIGTAAAVLDILHTEEGYIQNSGGTYTYNYNLTDHLGNVRTTFYKHPTTGVATVIQRDDYYPFGKQKLALGGTNKYLYNGKELQAELGQYDYGVRLYSLSRA